MNSLSVYQYLVNIGIISIFSPQESVYYQMLSKSSFVLLIYASYIYTFFEVSMQGQERHSKTQGKNIHCKSVL